MNDATYNFFEEPSSPLQKQYEAMRAYFYERKPAHEVAKKFGYSVNSLYCFASAFKKQLKEKRLEKRFFAAPTVGRPIKKQESKVDKLILALRKKYISVSEIKSILDTQVQGIPETYIYKLIKQEGFARLPRRNKTTKIDTMSQAKIDAPMASLMKKDKGNGTNLRNSTFCFSCTNTAPSSAWERLLVYV